jgi:CRISPR-associated endonuclease Csn1
LKDDGVNRGRECLICPKPYPDFAEKVRKACDEILVKHILRQTTLRQSFKHNVLAYPHREKGNPKGRMIRCVKSQGDTIRGQLHKESFYGCICMPSETNKVFVERVKIVDKDVGEVQKCVKNIIDPVVINIVTNRLEELKASGINKVPSGAISMPSGVPINKVRVKVSLKGPMCVRTHSHKSRLDYKNFIYAGTGGGSNFRLALYNDENGMLAIPENSLIWAQNHKKADYKRLDDRPGFLGYVYPGSMTLALRYKGEDVSKSSPIELRKRLYTVLSIGSEKETRAEFRRAIVAGKKKSIGKPARDFSIDSPPCLLRIGPAKYLSQMLFEGIHFKMLLDGSIEFMKR